MRLEPEYQDAFHGGAHDSAAPAQYAPYEAERLINMRVSLKGDALERRGGWFRPGRFNAVNGYGAVSAVVAGIEFETAAGAKQWVVINADEMLYSTDEGLTWTVGATGLGQLKAWSLVIIREGTSNVLCLANGGTNAYQWDGNTWSTIANIPSGVKYLAVHGGRLIAAGHSGVEVAASAVDDIDTWAAPDGWVVQAKTNDGDTAITGLFQLGTVLLVFKKKSVGYIEGFGYTTLQVETGARGVTRSAGCIAPRSIAQVGDQAVMWLSERGFERYQLGGVVQVVSERMRGLIDSIRWDVMISKPDTPVAVYWPRKREYWCALPVGAVVWNSSAWPLVGSTNDLVENSYIFVYRDPTERTPEAMWCNLLGESTARSDYRTVSVDASGRLCIDDALEGRQVTVTEGGKLGITDDYEYGFYVTQDATGDRLTLWGSTEMPYSFWIGDFRGEAGWLLGGVSATGFVAAHDWAPVADYDGDVSPAGGRNEWEARLRPLVFGNQFVRKKLKRFTLQTTQGQDASINVLARADGVAGVAKTLTPAGSLTTRLVESRERMGGRGFVHSIELRSESDVRIVGWLAEAEIMDDQR